MIIIGFDIATKSLAVSVICFNDNWYEDLSNIKKQFYVDILGKPFDVVSEIAIEYIHKLDELAADIIKIILFDVVDLIPNQKIKETDAILRTARLKGYLTNLDNKITSLLIDNNIYTNHPKVNSIKILLEYQMGPNDKSRNVCSQILYHYTPTNCNYINTFESDQIKSNKHSIEIIGPSLKNKINLDKDKNHQYFYNKYAKSYDANKKHSVNNMMSWLHNNGKTQMINNIRKKNLDDIADAFTMSIAWLFIKSSLI